MITWFTNQVSGEPGAAHLTILAKLACALSRARAAPLAA
jgi:hypothetical protein